MSLQRTITPRRNISKDPIPRGPRRLGADEPVFAPPIEAQVEQPVEQPVEAQAPATPAEAERRFWARYGPRLIAHLLGGQPAALPAEVEAWYELARQVRSALESTPEEAGRASMAAALERIAAALREA